MNGLLHILGIDDVSGRWYGWWSGFGSDLAIIGAVAASAWTVVRRMVAHHKERIGQAERHHLERQALATAHNNARLKQANTHHQQALDHAEGLAEAAKAHLTATLRLPAKQPRTPAAKPAAKGGE